MLSKALGSRTALSGSVNRGKNDPSQSLQMMERALMTPDELKSIPKGKFIVMKTGSHPMKTELRLFLKWGISFEEPYTVPERANRKVAYANFRGLQNNIVQSQPSEEKEGKPESERAVASGSTSTPPPPTVQSRPPQDTAESKAKSALRT